MRPICKSKIPLYNEHQYLIEAHSGWSGDLYASPEEMHYLASVALHEAVVDYVPQKHGKFNDFASKRISQAQDEYVKSLGKKPFSFDTGDDAVNAELESLHKRYGRNKPFTFKGDMFYCTYVKMERK